MTFSYTAVFEDARTPDRHVTGEVSSVDVPAAFAAAARLILRSHPGRPWSRLVITLEKAVEPAA